MGVSRTHDQDQQHKKQVLALIKMPAYLVYWKPCWAMSTCKVIVGVRLQAVEAGTGLVKIGQPNLGARASNRLPGYILGCETTKTAGILLLYHRWLAADTKWT